MPLTTAQLQAIKADILANQDLNISPGPAIPDVLEQIARLYNLPAVPDYWVYRSAVSLTEIGDNIVATEIAGMSALNMQRLQVMAEYSANNASAINPSLADRRAFFDQVFSGAGGAQTRPKLAILWRRLASRVEKLFAAGSGTTGSPATMAYEGPITPAEIGAARALP